MTTPPISGSPDFQGNLPWKSSNLFTGPNQVFPVGLTNTPVFASLSFSALQIKFVAPGGQGHLKVHWFADAAGAFEVGQDAWPFNNSWFLLVSLPTEAPFFSIHVTNNGAASFTSICWAMLTNEPVTRPTYPVAQSVLYGNSVSVPASGTVTGKLGRYAKGRGHLHLNPNDGAGKLNALIQATDETGTVTGTILRALNFVSIVDQDFPHPDDMLQLVIVNTDAAAAHVLDYALFVSDDC